MMQRDAHVLERTLQEIGMDGSDGGLSFELAQDGNLFDHDNGHGGSNHSGGGGTGDGENADDESEIVIATTMDWYVDPETGMTRYNILA